MVAEPGPGGVHHRTVPRARKIRKLYNATKKRGALLAAPPCYSKKWPTWVQLGSQNPAKIDKKSMQKSIIFLMPLGIDFLLDFDGFLVPKWSQIGVKMGSKIDVNLERPILQKYI